MEFALRCAGTLILVAAAVYTGRRHPALGGLIATMPLTTLIVLVWLHADAPGDYDMLTRYTKGVLWGIVPSILFFIAVHFCLTKRTPFAAALAGGFAFWLAAAAIHRWLVR